jgi:hypothetical protein
MPIIPKGTAVSQIVHNGDATFITIPQSFADLSPFAAAGVVCDGVTDTTAAMQALVTSIGSKVTTLVLPNTGSCVLSNITFPANIALDFTQGGSLQPVAGQTIIILGAVNAPLQKIFFNAISNQGAIDFTGGYSVDTIYPEWWGASPNLAGAINGPAIQAAILAAYGNQNRTNSNGNYKYNRKLFFSGIYGINQELQCYHMNGFLWEGISKLNCGLQQFGSGNLRIIDGQCVSYGTFRNLGFSNVGAASTNCLIDLDNDHTHGTDLSPQQITFYDCTFNGSGFTDTGVLCCKSGGAAQGDNIRAYNCNWLGFSGAGWQIGGNNTGRNAGRIYAENAIRQQIFGGDIQGCPLYGVASYGGSIDVIGTSMENGFTTQTGWDMYCEGVIPSDFCTMENVRSESRKLIAGSRLVVRNCFLADQSFFPVPGTNPAAGSFIQGSVVGGDGLYYRVTASGTMGGAGTPSTPLTATSGSSSTLTMINAGWTTNTFAGFIVSILSGTASNQFGIITSNTIDTLTISRWQTYINQYSSASNIPDNTSTFIVEPNWGTQFTSGGCTWTATNESGISGDASGNASQAIIDNVFVPGTTIKANSIVFTSDSSWRNVRVTARKWYWSGAPLTKDALAVTSMTSSTGPNIRISPYWGKLGSAVTSASTITPTGESFHVIGSANISTINGPNTLPGAKITVIFDGVLTVQNSGNVKIVQPLTTSVNSTLTLTWDGVNWYGE